MLIQILGMKSVICIVKIFGFCVFLDGLISLFTAFEPRLIYQVGRFVRMGIGIVLMLI